jgi:hypothetical protein
MVRLSYILRVRPLPDVVDPIRGLRIWLKGGLRNHGLRCEAIQEVTESDETRRTIETETEQENDDMTIDLSKEQPQQARGPIPAGVYLLEIKLKPGSIGELDPYLLIAKNQRTRMLALEYMVVEGEHAKRKLFDYITVAADLSDNPDLPPLDAKQRDNYNTSVRMGLSKLRAMIDSAHGLDTNDHSAEADTKRKFADWSALNGLRFWGQVEIRPARNGYRASNELFFVVTPGMPDYPKVPAQQSRGSQAMVPVKRDLRDDLDDSIPFILTCGFVLAELVTHASNLVV